MKRQIFIILLIFLPGLFFGQLYKCDSIYHNENYTITGGYKNGLKHGAWEYRSDTDTQKIIKYQEYWFGKLVRVDSTNIYHSPMFDLKDSIIEYAFGPTVNHVINKLLLPEIGNYFYCELRNYQNRNTVLTFYKKEVTIDTDIIDKFCAMTNRYIIHDNLQIQIITEYDRKFAHLGWTREYNSEIILDSNGLIIEIRKNGW